MFSKVSIIVPALNEGKVIGRCLEALLSQSSGSLQVEIILVDNGSDDNTMEIAKNCGVKTVQKKNVTVAALRNYGVSISDGDVLAFVDGDCIVGDGWLMNAMTCLSRENTGAVGSFHEIPLKCGWVGRVLGDIHRRKLANAARYIPSGNLILRRKTFEEVGGFNENLETNEDVDLSSRIRSTGCQLVLDPSIRSVHTGSPRSGWDVIRQQMWHGKNTMSLFLRNPRKGANRRIALYSMVSLIAIAGIVGGSLLVLAGSKYVLLVSVVLFVAINLIVSLGDWRKSEIGYFPILFYTVLYSTGRALSILGWIKQSVGSRSK